MLARTQAPLLLLSLCLCHALLNHRSDLGDQVNVTTRSGVIQGHTATLPKSLIQVYQFLGVPYAKPPLGSLRFRKPAPIGNWSGVFEASDFPPRCLQSHLNRTEGSEDCLYLNIWVPKRFIVRLQRGCDPELRPAMVWLHGGRYQAGSGSEPMTNGQFLAGYNDVLVVSVQYRLGPLGWLYLKNDAEASGNQALWDQRLALQWLADNLARFGGDPRRVTVFGEEAGAAAIGLHLLAKQQPKFQRAILQSGTSLAPWAVAPAQHVLKLSFDLYQRFSDRCLNNQSVVQCLQQQPAEEILLGSAVPGLVGYSPILEPEFFGRAQEELALENSTTRHEIPIMIGLNRDEGSHYLGLPETQVFQWNETYLRQSVSPLNRSLYHRLADRIPLYCHGEQHLDRQIEQSEWCRLERQSAKFHYLPLSRPDSELTNRDLLRAAEDMALDGLLLCPALRQASNSEIDPYVYLFDHRPSNSFWPSWAGVWRGDELPMTFGQPLSFWHDFTFEEFELSLEMMTYWTSFAKTGNPNSPGLQYWPTYSEQAPKILQFGISADTGPILEGFRKEHCQFWNVYLPGLKKATESKFSGVTDQDSSSPSSLSSSATAPTTTALTFFRFTLAIAMTIRLAMPR